jgi:hypothetical protein
MGARRSRVEDCGRLAAKQFDPRETNVEPLSYSLAILLVTGARLLATRPRQRIRTYGAKGS